MGVNINPIANLRSLTHSLIGSVMIPSNIDWLVLFTSVCLYVCACVRACVCVCVCACVCVRVTLSARRTASLVAQLSHLIIIILVSGGEYYLLKAQHAADDLSVLNAPTIVADRAPSAAM